eukprot:scaffold56091_cov33-Tisochrysis_lutea.AAC.3
MDLQQVFISHLFLSFPSLTLERSRADTCALALQSIREPSEVKHDSSASIRGLSCGLWSDVRITSYESVQLPLNARRSENGDVRCPLHGLIFDPPATPHYLLASPNRGNNDKRILFTSVNGRSGRGWRQVEGRGASSPGGGVVTVEGWEGGA